MTWPITAENMAGNLQLAAVGEVGVVAFTVKKMNFLTVRLCVEHALFGEMVGRTLPFKRISR